MHTTGSARSHSPASECQRGRLLLGECDSRRDPLVRLQGAHGLDSCYRLAGLLQALAVSPGADSRHNPAALAIGLADAGFGQR